MNYYLKKHWKTNTLVCLSKILGSALEVGQNLILIGLFQSVVDGRKDAFLSYALTLLALCAAQIAWGHFTTWLTSRAKMAMNNHYRADLAASLLAMDHTAFHSRDTGEYLSWYTNDVNQISTLAWDSVFSLVELAFQVVFSAVALAMMHWSLLAASLAVTLVTLTAPKFLGRGVEPVSQACTAQQAQATGKFKDLLSGLDVLVAFGRKKRFVEENNAASRQMEQPRHNLTCKQDFASREIGMVSVFCQLSLLLLIGLLSLNGQLIEAALTGGTNLAGGVTGGLSAIGQYLVAIRASKPYFEKVTVRFLRKRNRPFLRRSAGDRGHCPGGYLLRLWRQAHSPQRLLPLHPRRQVRPHRFLRLRQIHGFEAAAGMASGLPGHHHPGWQGYPHHFPGCVTGGHELH